MNRISDSEAVILGLLVDSPKYPYEIEKIIEEQSMREWTEIGFSSIYHFLSNMEKKKLVKSEMQNSEKNRTRKIFTLTPLGAQELDAHLETKFTDVKPQKWAFDLALAYLNVLPEDKIIPLMEKYRKSIESLIQGYRNLLQYLTENECPLNRLQLAHRPIALYTAEITWIDRFILDLKRSMDQSPP